MVEKIKRFKLRSLGELDLANQKAERLSVKIITAAIANSTHKSANGLTRDEIIATAAKPPFNIGTVDELVEAVFPTLTRPLAPDEDLHRAIPRSSRK